MVRTYLFFAVAFAVMSFAASLPAVTSAQVAQPHCYTAAEPTATGPAAPTNLEARFRGVPGGTAVDLTWQDNATDEMCYVIEHVVGFGPTWAVFAVLPANTTSYTDAGPYASASDPARVYRVYAATSTTRSSPSNTAGGGIPIANGTPTPTPGSGQIIGGSPPPASGGFGLFVFGGGTFAQLESAACPGSTNDAYWVTTDGDFTVFVPNTAVGAVNEQWYSTFPNAVIPANTPIIGKCR